MRSLCLILLLSLITHLSLAELEEEIDVQDTLRTILDGQRSVLEKIEDLQSRVSLIEKTQKMPDDSVRHREKKMEVTSDMKSSTILFYEQEKRLESILKEQERKLESILLENQEAVLGSLQRCTNQKIAFHDIFEDLLIADECKDGTHNCSAHATCKNALVLYDCTCLPGYAGDGITCEDINECEEDPERCGFGGTCINHPGNYSCTCLDGFKEEDNTCMDINECKAKTDECHTFAYCENTIGSYNCQCYNSYFGDGRTCTGCYENEWECVDGSCIVEQSRCDGHYDCRDLSDEDDCYEDCPGWKCAEGSCIGIVQRCDNHTDCLDNSDEENCTIGCDEAHWTCIDGSCITKRRRCDGRFDCRDFSDEEHCECKPYEFTCKEGTCISAMKRCDCVKDCLNGEDEDLCDPSRCNGFVTI
ncbi:hypothetical protein SK128_011952 [Halocaridina rubra]|uniref:EGF-like domain-containing protein n=1 Tax=Halocaridina rubra TaxID=373956 RepID=A0AAN8XS67_HALRR